MYFCPSFGIDVLLVGLIEFGINKSKFSIEFVDLYFIFPLHKGDVFSLLHELVSKFHQLRFQSVNLLVLQINLLLELRLDHGSLLIIVGRAFIVSLVDFKQVFGRHCFKDELLFRAAHTGTFDVLAFLFDDIHASL